MIQELPWWLCGKESTYNAGDLSLIPGLGRSLRERNDYPPQYSCLEIPMDRGAWWATVHGVTNRHNWACMQTGRQTQTHTHTHTHTKGYITTNWIPSIEGYYLSTIQFCFLIWVNVILRGTYILPSIQTLFLPAVTYSGGHER